MSYPELDRILEAAYKAKRQLMAEGPGGDPPHIILLMPNRKQQDECCEHIVKYFTWKYGITPIIPESTDNGYRIFEFAEYGFSLAVVALPPMAGRPELTGRELAILEMRNFGQSVKDIAKSYNVTPSRIRQIENKANRKLQALININIPPPFSAPPAGQT
jgi:DNA-binding CsgD family transcriptional regulator